MFLPDCGTKPTRSEQLSRLSRKRVASSSAFDPTLIIMLYFPPHIYTRDLLYHNAPKVSEQRGQFYCLGLRAEDEYETADQNFSFSCPHIYI